MTHRAWFSGPTARAVRTTAALAAAIVAASTVHATDPTTPADVLLEERSRVRLRTVRLRIEPTADAAPGECRALGLDDLKVRLRGALLDRRSLLRFDRPREPTLHALLIDTSSSMVGKLDHARRAAAEYVRQLDPEFDRAMVATFDESVILAQRPTADRELLARSIEGIRMAAMTSMLDGLYYGIGELLPGRERPVVVLLSDGVDSASLAEQEHVRRLAERRDDLIVFAIGYALPPLDRAATGVIATRKFLERLAASTDGEFFDVPTGGRLDFAFRKIHESLENEAELTFLDPLPDAELGKVRVRLPTAHCKLHVYRENVPGPPEQPATPDDPSRIPVIAAPRERFLADQRIHHRTDERCRNDRAQSLDDLWFVRGEAGRIRGCVLDVTTEFGLLYSHLNRSRVQQNGWVMMRTRPIEIVVPDLVRLPATPAEALDALADRALAVADDAVETDARMRPAERHARPWLDIPTLVNGRTLLQSRGAIARALYADPQYRDWADRRVAADVAAELKTLRERFARLAPGAAPADVARAVALSDEGQRIARRAEQPTTADLQRNLGAWLGDISASALFGQWEARGANRLLDGVSPADAAESSNFLVRWRAVRRMFFVPSYARVLGLLSPVHDAEDDRIGFWRVLLPRPGWLQPRLKNAVHHPEWKDLPLDLVPGRPLGYEVLRTALERDPDLRAEWVANGYRVTDIHYTLLGKPFRQDPRRAFRETRVTLTLEAEGRPALQLDACVGFADDAPVEVDALNLSDAPDGSPADCLLN